MSSYMQPFGEVATYEMALLVGEKAWGPSLADRPPNMKLPIGLLPYPVGFKVHKKDYFVAMLWTLALSPSFPTLQKRALVLPLGPSRLWPFGIVQVCQWHLSPSRTCR